MKRNSRIGLRIPLSVAMIAGLAGVVLAGGSPVATANGSTHLIKMDIVDGKLKFTPKTTNAVFSDTLTIKNKTRPRQVGPHSFSLVTDTARPDSKPEFRKCFNKGHICRKVAKWHDVNLQTGEVGTQEVEVGNPGWDTMGDLDTIGDSWVTETKNETHSRTVADANTTLTFFCAVHPKMRGKIVVPPV